MDALDLFIILLGLVGLVCFGLYRSDEIERESKSYSRPEPIDSSVSNIAPPEAFCTYCGAPMFPRAVFCSACLRMTPRVKESLDASPEKQPHEFLTHSDSSSYKCPHCLSSGITVSSAAVPTPIIYCPFCTKYFLDVSIREPYINRKTNKWEKALSAPLNICLLTLMGTYYFALSFWLWLIATGVLIALYTLLHTKDTPYALDASKVRVEQNPEYLQCLADMGYLHRMTPKFRAMTVGYVKNTNDLICEYCGSANPFEESYCTHCTAPLPNVKYKRRYIHPPTDFSEYESFSTEFLLRVVLFIIALIFIATFMWIGNVYTYI